MPASAVGCVSCAGPSTRCAWEIGELGMIKFRASISLVSCLLLSPFASAETPPFFPEPVVAVGAMDGSSVDTGGISLSMTSDEISATFGRANTGKSVWLFRNTKGLEPASLKRDYLSGLNASREQDGSKEVFNIDLSQWHTGGRTLRIGRHVKVDDPARSSETVFINAMVERYGAYLTTTAARKGKTYSWYYNNGAIDGDCQPLNPLPSKMSDAYIDIEYEDAQQMIAAIDAGQACGGELNIAIEVDGSGRVEKWVVELVDVRAVLFDTVNDDDTEAQMRQYYLDAAASGGEVKPKL